jgi:glycosyltransferase involved in cell wall biosynthesis
MPGNINSAKSLKNDLPVTAIVVFSSGAFGGAEKRFTNLFRYLSQKYPGKIYLIINSLLSNHLNRVFPDINREYIITGGEESPQTRGNKPAVYNDRINEPEIEDQGISFLRKTYRYFKNKAKQKKLFGEIEKVRTEKNIEIFTGVFAGVLPLVFYFDKPVPRPAVIFSDMDSWFSEIVPEGKKFWYRKYYSFNYTLESADHIDFLSPYILEGVKKRNVKIENSRTSIAPCSFIDYSKCKVGSKKNMEISFASRMEPDKNPMLYLEAAKTVLESHPDVKFHILGEGSLVNEVKEFISANKLEGKVEFSFHPNPPEIFAETSIFVSLQSGTNYPSQSLIEAMACGNAVIASNTGDTNLLINDTNGILTGLRAEELVDALLKLIRNREQTMNMALNARKFVLENHTIEKYTEYFEDMIIAVHQKSKSIGKQDG